MNCNSTDLQFAYLGLIIPLSYHNPSKDNICNCDDMNSADVDSGLLTNKNHLPVSQLNYGDSAGRYSWIEYELGPLICQGQGGLYPSETFEHDFKFKVAANTQESSFSRLNGQHLTLRTYWP